MFGCVFYDGKVDIGYFYADTIAELSNLPNLTESGKFNLSSMNAVSVGSRCDCYEDKNVYILKGNNTWQIFKPIESSGSGGSSYTLPTASASVLGGVKVGNNLSIDSNGVLSADDQSTTPYTLPTASTTTLGGVKIDGTTIIIDDGVISATNSGSQYTLPTASTNTLGGVKIDGTTVTIDANGVISATQPLELEQTNIALSTSTTTTVTFTNANITANSFIEYGCSQWNLVPDDIVTSTGSCVITLPKVDTAATVTVRIYVR